LKIANLEWNENAFHRQNSSLKLKAGLTGGTDLQFIVVMMKKLFGILAICGSAVWWSGCVSTVDGRQQVGVPFIKDQFHGRYERPVLEVWKAANDVLGYNGNLYSVDVMRSSLEATVEGKTVWMKVEAVDPKVTEITVQVRTKNGGTDLELARELDKQIAVRLATGTLPAPAGKQTGGPELKPEVKK
jgi:hypothetical protein